MSFDRRTLLQGAGAASLASLFPVACAAPEANAEFDYIIIGAGSAGCVLARRLSDDPNTRVLLIEAGGAADHPSLNDGLRWFSMLTSDLVYPDMTAPQAGLSGKEILAAHGKGVGGSSAINAMIHHWPVPGDIDGWDIPGWGWKDIAPMLTRSETYGNGPSGQRGDSGPIGVMRLPDPPALAEAAMQAAERQGFGVSDDINGAAQLGVGLNQLAFADEKRQHTGLAYLDAAAGRPNLQVLLETQVEQLVIEQGRCVGVVISAEDWPRIVRAQTTVLSAGALRSPQILMLSGIGPAGHLREMDVPVVMDQPQVGENLHEHLLFSGNNFAATGAGESQFHGSVAVLYAQSPSGRRRRDIVCNISTNARVFPPLESAAQGYKTSFSFTKPQSRGSLRLASRDPAVQPALDHRFLSDERDVTGALEALEVSRALFADDAFSAFDPQELNSEALSTDDGRRAFLNAAATSFGHHCGTLAMGKDLASPVAPDLSFRGIEGLKVVDASIIPVIPSCPTNALVVAMAELAASRLTA